MRVFAPDLGRSRGSGTRNKYFPIALRNQKKITCKRRPDYFRKKSETKRLCCKSLRTVVIMNSGVSDYDIQLTKSSYNKKFTKAKFKKKKIFISIYFDIF